MPIRPSTSSIVGIGVYLMLLVSLAVGQLAGAATVTVSSVGEITAALLTNQPGDTIVLTNKVWQSADILFKQHGTAANPITLRAQTPGQVILSGSSRLRIAGTWLVVDGLRFQNGYHTNSDVVQFRENSSSLATNCALLNSAIVDYSAPLPPNAATDFKWVSVQGLSNRVENCYLKGKTNMGATLVVVLAGPDNLSAGHVIRRNHFGPRPELGQNGGETIRVGTGDTSTINARVLVEENLFSACDGEVETVSNKSCENEYRHNTFEACAGTITLRQGDRCTVAGNWFFGHGQPDTGGVRILGEDQLVMNNYFVDLTGTGARSALAFMNGSTVTAPGQYVQVKRARVLFNTLVGCASSFTIGEASSGTFAPVDCTNANNVVVGSVGPLVNVMTAPTNFFWQGNFCAGAAVGLTNAGITTVNPLLALGGDGLWRPATNSPVRGFAVGLYPMVVDDFDGQVRTVPMDAGCDQISGEATLLHPLGPTEVGPAWMRSIGPPQGIGYASNALTISWDSVPAMGYQVQYSSNLLAWVDVSQVVSNLQNTASWTDDGSQTGSQPGSATRRFYRVRLMR